ncbi:LPXTG cell wall anchor domain-containing protein [Streptomyces sp. NPDC090445]|uniref:LPXTG cell wall anchor domain-containing protein n=1 Tax=Streptomyces sp. NPDC090445 TaxID=3365963 RepID=UPI0038270BB9
MSSTDSWVKSCPMVRIRIPIRRFSSARSNAAKDAFSSSSEPTCGTTGNNSGNGGGNGTNVGGELAETGTDAATSWALGGAGVALAMGAALVAGTGKRRRPTA